jgi:ADP-heptose:LPS heptosyltransferase
MKILVSRPGALGDVVCATPIPRELARRHPKAEIVFETGYPAVFENNPHCRAVNQAQDRSQFDRVIDLALAYERRPTTHIARAFWDAAFDEPPERKDQLRPELFYGPDRLPQDPYRPFVAVHAAYAGWGNRTLPSKTWAGVVASLNLHRLAPILVGTERDAIPGLNVRSYLRTSLLHTAQIIAGCACFAGSDSALLHVAAATPTPIVGVFTSVRPKYRLPYGTQSIGISPELDCLYCQERVPPPSMFETCERDEDEKRLCVKLVDSEQIVNAVLTMIWPVLS